MADAIPCVTIVLSYSSLLTRTILYPATPNALNPAVFTVNFIPSEYNADCLPVPIANLSSSIVGNLISAIQ